MFSVQNAPNKTSYGTLEVNVTDIDDNDPVFSHPGYVLHVQEEVSRSFSNISLCFIIKG